MKSRAPSFEGIQSQRSCSTHSFSGSELADYPFLVEALLAIKVAASRANELDSHQQHRIEEACNRLRLSEFRDWFPVDVWQGGGAIAVNMNINEAIVSMAGAPHLALKDEVNASQSTADVCATALRLTLARNGKCLIDAIESVVATLSENAKELDSVASIARTCLQDASPTHLGVLFSGAKEVLGRNREYLRESLSELRKVNLGGTVFGSGEGASARYRNRVLLDLQDVLFEWDWPHETLHGRDNLYDAAQNMDDLTRLSSATVETAYSLIKLCQDIRLLASTPFGEVQLPEVIQGSSFYRGKLNPTLPETVMQSAFRVLGQDRVVGACRQSGELHLNVFEFSAGIAICDSLEWLSKSIRNLDEYCLRNIKAGPQKEV